VEKQNASGCFPDNLLEAQTLSTATHRRRRFMNAVQKEKGFRFVVLPLHRS